MSNKLILLYVIYNNREKRFKRKENKLRKNLNKVEMFFINYLNQIHILVYNQTNYIALHQELGEN